MAQRNRLAHWWTRWARLISAQILQEAFWVGVLAIHPYKHLLIAWPWTTFKNRSKGHRRFPINSKVLRAARIPLSSVFEFWRPVTWAQQPKTSKSDCTVAGAGTKAVNRLRACLVEAVNWVLAVLSESPTVWLQSCQDWTCWTKVSGLRAMNVRSADPTKQLIVLSSHSIVSSRHPKSKS